MTVILCDHVMKPNDLLRSKLQTDPQTRLICLEPGQMAAQQIRQEKPDVLLLASSTEQESEMLLQAVDDCGVKTVVCFIGSCQELTAFSYHSRCDLFLQKPFQAEEVTRFLANLKLLAGRIKHFRAVTFGHFNIYVNEIPILLRNAKAKELLALCIDRRGGEVSLYDAITTLWPYKVYDERAKRLYRKAVISLNNTLQKYDASRLFISTRGSCHIDPSLLSCDYFSFSDNPKKYLPLFRGMYMTDYDWAEVTLGRLFRLVEKECDIKLMTDFY